MKTKLSIIALIGLFLFAGYLAKPSHAQEVYQTCNASRMSETINETACVNLQEKYKIEFLCANNDSTPGNRCWTEQKDRNFQ